MLVEVRMDRLMPHINSIIEVRMFIVNMISLVSKTAGCEFKTCYVCLKSRSNLHVEESLGKSCVANML